MMHMRDMRAEYIERVIADEWRAAKLPELIADGVCILAICALLAFAAGWWA